MKIRLLLLVYVFCGYTPFAQNVKEYPVKAGEIPGKVIPVNALYIFPAFTSGEVKFKNGTTSTQLFNYNILLDEIHFINNAGDTLAIAEPAIIKTVAIDSLLFYYDRGYMRQILKMSLYKLAVKQQLVQINDKTRGGYDIPTGISAITTYGSVSTANSRVYHLQVKKDVLFREVISFYIADMSNHFLKANKKNFYALFSEKKVAEYLGEHKINYDKEEDLKAFLQFCAE